VLGGGVLTGGLSNRPVRLGGGQLVANVGANTGCLRTGFCAHGPGLPHIANERARAPRYCVGSVSAWGSPVKFRFPSLTLNPRFSSPLTMDTLLLVTVLVEPLSCLGSRPFCCAAFGGAQVDVKAKLQARSKGLVLPSARSSVPPLPIWPVG